MKPGGGQERRRGTGRAMRPRSGRTVRRIFLPSLVIVACLLLTVLRTGAFPTGDLKGEITTEQLYANSPVFEQNARAFTPSPEAIEHIGRMDEDLDVVVFLGTWCHDSRLEVPRLLKILETANNPHISLELYAVDHAIKDGVGFAVEYGVSRVPTIVFVRDGEELGRMVEHPPGTMEDAILEISQSAE